MNKLAIVEATELALVESNALNGEQLKHLLKSTPKQYVKSRPAKGGGRWDYVTAGYVKKVLNLMFGWDWDFEIVQEIIEHGEVVVKGRLTCRTGGKTISKMQYGNKDVMCKRGTSIPLSIGNDLKAAASDCLKKCAAEIGIAADIYNKEDFKEVLVATEPIKESKSKDRILKFIAKAKTIEDLNQVSESMITSDVDVSDAYRMRKEALNG